MFQRFGIKLICWLLQNSRLSEENNALLTTAVLDKIGALPYKDIIAFGEEGVLTISDKPLTLEQAVHLKESAATALNNTALSLVFEQVRFKAVTQAVHKAETVNQVFWGRVGLWWAQEIRSALEQLAQTRGDVV